MNYEEKKEFSKKLAETIMNMMVEGHVSIEDCIDICGIAMAAICACVPAPMTEREAIASFFAAFSDTLYVAKETDTKLEE